jgi:hypothetical protein
LKGRKIPEEKRNGEGTEKIYQAIATIRGKACF